MILAKPEEVRCFDKLSTNGEWTAISPNPFALSLSKGRSSFFLRTER
ncbi:hypothetical protein [Sphingomonas sp. RS2018]